MLLKNKYRSELSAAKLTALLEKIRIYSSLKPNRFVVKKGEHIYKGNMLVDFTVDETEALETLIVEHHPAAKLGIASSLIVQDLTYTAAYKGTLGDDISIEYVDDETAGDESVSVVGTAITVHIESGASTATQVKAAIDASVVALALVSVAISGTAGDFQVTAALDNLENGSNVENFDKVDILAIRRLRTKKYMIIVKQDADPV